MKKLNLKHVTLILLSVLCAALMGVGIALFNFGGDNTKLTENNLNKSTSSVSAAAGAIGNVSAGQNTRYAKEIHLSGTKEEMADGWSAAVKDSVANSCSILVVLDSDWSATANFNSSGNATGFGISTGGTASPFETDGGLVVCPGAKITLDLNGHKVDRNTVSLSNADVWFFRVYGTFTVCDSSGNDTGKITGGSINGNGSAVYIESSGKFILNSGTITENNAGVSIAANGNQINGAVYTNGGTIEINGGAITKNNSNVALSVPGGGGIGIINGTLNITGGLISENLASWGAGIAMRGTTFTMSGGTISGNKINSGADAGGGIYMHNDCVATMTGGTISGNEAALGGGISVTLNAVFTMSGGEISGNTAYNYGGGLQVYGASGQRTNVIITGGKIADNKIDATNRTRTFTYDDCGGGVLVCQYATVSISNTEITGNKSTGYGGGVYVTVGTLATSLSLNNCIITGNEAAIASGGLNVESKQTVEISGGVVITDNKGGNAYLAGGALNNLSKFKITGPLTGNGYVTQIGVTAGLTNVIFTTGYGNYYTNSDAVPSTFFFADDPTQYIRWSSGTEANIDVITNLPSQYEVRDVAWSYKVAGSSSWISVPSTVRTVTLTYGDPAVTEVKGEFTSAKQPANNKTFSANATSNNFGFYSGTGANATSFTGLSDVGRVSFGLDNNDPCYAVTYTTNSALTFIMQPKDVEVVIQDKTSVYGDTSKQLTCYDSTDVAGMADVTAAYGVTLAKDYGYGVGKYAIRGTGWTNANYNVTFVNSGVYTITQREVTVILNEAEFAYGADSIAVSQALNNTVNSDGKYIGGWRYETGSKEFISADLTATRKPFKLSSTAEYTAAQSAVSSFVFPSAGTTQTITTSDLNPNYKITFKRDNDTSGATTGKLSIVNAQITVNPDATHGRSTVYELKDVGSGKTLEIPAANIKIKGDQNATKTITYADYVFDSKDEKATAPAQLPKLDTSVTPNVYKWQDGKWNGTSLVNTAVGNWIGTTSATALTKTTAGTYKAIFKISVPNHDDLVIDWTLVINSKTVSVTLRAEKETSGSWAALSGHATYGDNVRAAVDMNAITDPEVDKTKLTNYTVYYKGTTAGSKVYPDVSGITFDADGFSPDKTIHNVHGTTVAPTAAGTYTATLVPKDGDYKITGTLSCSISVDKMKITKAPADTNTTGLTYNGTEQSFKLGSSYDDAIMQLDGYTDPNGAAITPDSDFAKTKSWALKAKNAGDYTAKFSIKDKANYEWATSGANAVDASKVDGNGVYSLTLTVNKAAVKIKWEAPDPEASDPWTWQPSDYPSSTGGTDKYIKYELDSSSIMPATGTKDVVTVELYWTLVPETGFSTSAVADDMTTAITNDITTGRDILDISAFTKGKYYIYAVLEDASTNAVNGNYVIELEYGLPKTNDARQAFEVTDGSANLSGMPWKYKYLNESGGSGYIPAKLYVSGSADPADDTKLVYTPLSATTAREYVLELDAADGAFPSYLEIDTDAGAGHPVAAVSAKIAAMNLTFVSGAGYTAYKQTDAGSYTTYVLLKIKGNDTKFENKSGMPYTYVDDTHAIAKFEWEIGKAEVDLSEIKIEYGWINDDTGEIDWHDYDDKNKPVYRDSWVHIRVKGGTSYPAGITKAEIVNETTDYTGDRDMPGTVSARVKFTLDKNYVYVKNGVTYDTSFNETVSIELSKKKIPVSWTLTTIKDADGKDVLDDNGLPYQIYVLDFGADLEGYAQYIKYEYYYADMTDPSNPAVGGKVPASASGTTTHAQLDHLIDVDGAGKSNGSSTKTVDIFIRPVLDTTVSGADNFVLEEPAGGADQYTRLGQKKNAVTVTQVATEIVYGSKVENLEELYTLAKGTAKYSANSYTARVYFNGEDKGDASAFDFSTADAGTYTIKFALKASVANSDALSKTSITLEITQKEIEVPQIAGEIVFNSETLNLADYLDGKYKEYLDAGIITAISGRATARNVSSEPYVAKIEIIDLNYKWKEPAVGGASATKALLKATLTDNAATEITVDGARVNAEYSWNIAPYRLTSDVLNLSGKDGAVFNTNKLPEWARQLVTDGELLVGVNYYADEAGTTELSEEERVLKAGRQYYVKPVIGGKEAANFTFAVDGSVTNAPAKATVYKVPQSGAAAVFGNIKDFATKKLLGLPIWMWLLIAVAVLLFLIIIIAVARRRRKTKEAREEKKAAKEAAKAEAQAKADAEKERREAEKARLESQREIEKMKAEAEAAKAKAQAEAEIAKIKAQAQAQPQMQQAMPQPMPMPAMQQQMPQMPMQQAMQPQMPQAMSQTMPMQQPQQPMPQMQQQPTVDNGALARIEAELAAIRAAQLSGGGSVQNADANFRISELKAELASMRAEQRASDRAEHKAEQDAASARMEAEIARLRADLGAGYMPRQVAVRPTEMPYAAKPNGMNFDAETFGAVMAAMLRNMAAPAKEKVAEVIPAELPPQVIEDETAPVGIAAVYPPDAVTTTTTTTTTTVDTTKDAVKDSARRDENGFFDIDGFYDKYEGNK